VTIFSSSRLGPFGCGREAAFYVDNGVICPSPLPPVTALCDGRLDADVNRARAKLQECVRHLAVVLAKIRSNYARRIIPPDLVAALASEADGLLSDLKAARESLTCP
jgi:hypothetical protein